MLKHHIKLALRNLWKNRLFSALNLVGLTLGLASIMTLVFGVYTYYSADAAIDDKDNLYYLKTVEHSGEDYLQTTFPLLDEILRTSPEVTAATHIQRWSDPWIAFEGREVKENTNYVDKEFFEVFTLPFKYGIPSSALKDKYSAVITSEISKELFGEHNPLGKTIKADDSINLTVTGVLQPLNSYSNIDAQVFLTVDLLYENKGFAQNANWYNSFAQNYLRLKPNIDLELFETKIDRIVQRNYEDHNNIAKISVNPFSQLKQDFNPTISTIVKGAIGATIFVLIIILVNLMNINASILYGRIKENAVRKILGSNKSSLIWQFCIENGILVGSSIILAGILFIGLLQPQMNSIYGNSLGPIDFQMERDYPVFVMYFLLGLLITIVVSVLPALPYLNLPIHQAIKGKLKTFKSDFLMRNAFITLQFSLSIIFICAAVILNNQISFMKNADLGFNTSEVSLISISRDYENKEAAQTRFKSILNELKSNPYVKDFSTTSMVPFSYRNNYNTFVDPETGNELSLRKSTADAGYLKTYEIPIIQGRNFSQTASTSEQESIIINKKAMQLLGWTDLENKQLIEKGDGTETYKVVGVMENFHYQNMQEQLEPIMQYYGGESALDYNDFLSLNIVEGHEKEVLDELKAKINAIPARRLSESSHIKNRIDTSYNLMEGILKTVNYVAFLTIIIACLGMFGLISLIARKKVKEIAIRKTLGAGVANVAVLLSKDFIKLVLLASFIALPLAWLLMNNWLQNFAYRITISWWMLTVAAGIALFITLITVSFQAIKAAIANPVHSLKSE